MKARDIIPDWPKPRSTSAFNLGRCDSAWFRWMMRMNRIDQPERLAEFDATIEYHEAQQRMMDEYLAHWRTAERGELFRVPVHAVGAGELGRCFGFSIPD